VALSAAAMIPLWLRRRRLLMGLRDAGGHLSLLFRQPGRLAAMALSSMGTTAVLSLGFAVTVNALSDTRQVPPVGALIVVYLVASAIGGATPLPAFVGVTEAALVAGLTFLHVPMLTAVVATVVFRGIAFWAPVPLGVAAARRLRSAQLL